MQDIRYKPIGIIHSPFSEVDGMPIQTSGALGIKGTVEVFTEYCAGLKDIDGFSHIILVYHFHLAKRYILETRPFLEEETHGIFAVRAPARPNPIGISVVRLVRVEDNILHIEDVDIVDGTPLLDIKPYVPDFDWRQAERTGWLTEKSKRVRKHKSDTRFKAEP
ncbi:MAG: tRNA (N6-threonylcarbamoyladenosine(37)-N6)-methyltransferase TrmO [Dehalococcoidia bacterium]|nr:tRNA (N6-threonylcarbamoyladenosine(37)-N6)-methyltransferase TrmO [Dehalococcoidia bacterium]